MSETSKDTDTSSSATWGAAGSSRRRERQQGFVVVVGDPVTAEVDCYGPYVHHWQAEADARKRISEFDLADLPEVIVVVARCTPGSTHSLDAKPPAPHRVPGS